MNKKLIIRTLYIILIANIFITLMMSSLIMSFKGAKENVLFSFENDPEFMLALFLGFIILYPLSSIIFFTFAIIIQLLIRAIRKDGPAEI